MNDAAGRVEIAARHALAAISPARAVLGCDLWPAQKQAWGPSRASSRPPAGLLESIRKGVRFAPYAGVLLEPGKKPQVAAGSNIRTASI